MSKVTFGTSLRMGPGQQGNQPSSSESWNFHCHPHPTSQEREEGGGAGGFNQSPRANGLRNHAYVMEPPQEPRRPGFRELLGWWTDRGAGRVVCSENMEALGPFPQASPYASLPAGCS